MMSCSELGICILVAQFSLFLLLFFAQTWGKDFACLAKDTVNWREGPGIHHGQKFVFKKAQSWPVIIQREKDGWCFVEDYLGRTGWVKKKMLHIHHTALTKQDDVPVHATKDSSHKLCFLEKGCVVHFVNQNKNDKAWSMVQVKTPGGKIKGWVRSCHLWPTP